MEMLDRYRQRRRRPGGSASIEKSKVRGRESGLASVEIAFFLPIAMMVVLGVVQFAQMFMVQRELHGAATTGARTGSMQTSTVSEVQSAIQTYLNSSSVGSDYTPTITGVGPSANGDTLVTVTVEHDFELMLRLPIPGFDGGTVPLSASVTMRHE